MVTFRMQYGDEEAGVSANLLHGFGRFMALGHFPRKKKAAVPVKARTCPLALSGLQKNGSRPPKPACAFAPHASGTPSSNREDSGLYLTIFILWGAEPICMTLLVSHVRTKLACS